MSSGTTKPAIVSFFRNGVDEHLIPFVNSLSLVNKAIMLITLVPAPVYFTQGQIFDLFDTIDSIIDGNNVSIVYLITLLSETFLILYSLFIIIQYYSETRIAVLSLKLKSANAIHGCIVFKSIPTYLKHEEKKPEDLPTENPFSFNTQSAQFHDSLPDALEILKNTSEMIEVYNRYHESDDDNIEKIKKGSKSLKDILGDSTPGIETQSDLENLIQS